VRHWFVRSFCAALFVFLVSFRYLFSSGLDQLRSSANPINNFGVVHVANTETWVFQRLEYSHTCRLLYFSVLCILTWMMWVCL